MSWFWWTLLLYVGVAVFTAWVNVTMTPASVGLSVMRGVLWPWWWATGRPRGWPVPMD